MHWPDNEITICASAQYFTLRVYSLIHSIKPFYHSLTKRGISKVSGQRGQCIYLFDKYLLGTYYVLGTGTADKNPYTLGIYMLERRGRQ